MSHFTVLVIGDDPEDQLIPYDESISVEEYEENKVSDEEKERFVEHYKESNPEDKDLPFDEMYSKYGNSWNGERWRKDSDGILTEYSTYNPKSKWDWYSLGGRWTGFFKVKPGSKVSLGQPGVFGNKAPEGTADQLKKGDIDLDAMFSEAADEAAKKWDEIMTEEVMAIPAHEPWEKFVSRMIECKEKEGKDAIRNEYHNQPRIVAMKKSIDNCWLDCDDFLCTKEEYIGLAMASCITPFAIVKDGEWYEKGEMGWFGMAHNEKKQSNWNKEVYDLINSLPDDTLLSLYDCHI